MQSVFSFIPPESLRRETPSDEQGVTAILEPGLNVDHISSLRASSVSSRAKFPGDYAAISRLLNYTARFATAVREHGCTTRIVMRSGEECIRYKT